MSYALKFMSSGKPILIASHLNSAFGLPTKASELVSSPRSTQLIINLEAFIKTLNPKPPYIQEPPETEAL